MLGFFGVSAQVAFMIDLVRITTLPTRLIYMLLRTIYSKSVALIIKVYEFITKNDKKWITCPYS